MRGSRRRRKGWVRWGCLGLIVVLGVLVLWFVFLAGSALWKTFTQSVESRSLHQPVTAGQAGATAENVSPGDPAVAPPSGPPAEGTVVLDFEVGEFEIVAGEPGDGVRVEARYDVNSYELTQEHQVAGDGSWTYTIEFHQTGLLRDNGLRAWFGGEFPKIRVALPPDVPLKLQGSFAMGGSTLELGGLWLTSVDLYAEKGGSDVDFAEPTVEPLDHLTIRSRQGGLSAGRIGNASPRQVRIQHSMGGMGVSLHGAWRNDSDIRIRHSMGGAGVALPDDVRIDWPEGGGRTVGNLASPEIPGPTLSIAFDTFLGRMHTEVLPGSGSGAEIGNVINE